MREITLEDYKRVDRQAGTCGPGAASPSTPSSMRSSLTGLIILGVTLGDVFPWAGLPMVCWGVGVTLHYLYGVRWVDKTISGRQAQIQQRAAAGKRAT